VIRVLVVAIAVILRASLGWLSFTPTDRIVGPGPTGAAIMLE
jgi:hypothetical protein